MLIEESPAVHKRALCVHRLLKRAIFHLAGRFGLTSTILGSSWRARRLLILGYHGVSLDDENQWDPSLYLSPQKLRSGFDVLRELDCNVLPLDEAVERLQAGTLPPRSVALTFDDGFYDFYRQALPILGEYRFPATIYLTTYYCEKNLPVFDPMLSYLLWKGRGNGLVWPEVAPDADVASFGGRADAVRRSKLYAFGRRLDAGQKDEFLTELAGRLRLDYGDVCRRRILHLLRPDEVRLVAQAGIDVELHTHHHRVSNDQQLFDREILDNRNKIKAFTGRNGQRHFCYPGGFYLTKFADWLKQLGIVSATTCEPGLASRESNPLFLPRLILTSAIRREELTAWVSGLADCLPRRRALAATGQLLEGPPV